MPVNPSLGRSAGDGERGNSGWGLTGGVGGRCPRGQHFGLHRLLEGGHALGAVHCRLDDAGLATTVTLVGFLGRLVVGRELVGLGGFLIRRCCCGSR